MSGLAHTWDAQARGCRSCGVKRWMVDEGTVADECVTPVTCTCNHQLKADVRRHGRCIRGGCPVQRERAA